jgi:hypothetical protein
MGMSPQECDTPIRTEAQAAALAPLLDAPLDLTTFRYAVDYYHPLREAPPSP